MLTIRHTNARGNPMGESNRLCLHPDETVARARTLRAEGATYQQVADALGVPISTAWRWCTRKTRKPPVAVRFVRPKTTTHLSAEGADASSCGAHGSVDGGATPTPTLEQRFGDLL